MDRDEVEGIGVDGNNDENEEWRRMIQAGQVGEVRKVERNAEVAVRANDILIGMVKSEGRKGEEGGPISVNKSQVSEMQNLIGSQKSSLFSLLLLRSTRKIHSFIIVQTTEKDLYFSNHRNRIDSPTS